MRKITELGLVEALLPPSISKDLKFLYSSQAVNLSIYDCAQHLIDGLILCRIDELSSETLDYLAAQWLVSAWRDSWNIELKRNIIKTVIQEKCRFGTLSAVFNSLVQIRDVTEIVEWWQTTPQGVPHTFSVYADQGKYPDLIDEDLVVDSRRMIDYTKPVRSQYYFYIKRLSKAEIILFNGFRTVAYARISGFIDKLTNELSGTLYSGAGGLPVASSRISMDKTIPSSRTIKQPLSLQNSVRPVATGRISNL